MRIAAPLAAVAAAAALSACGGGDSQATGVPPREWAEDVCSAVGSWVDDFVARADDLQSAATGVTSLEEGRTLIVDFLEFGVERTDELLADVEAVGQPDVDEGEAIARDFRENLVPFREALADALERAQNLSLDDPAEFEREATEIGMSIETAGEEVGGSFDGLAQRYEAVRFEGDPPEACTELEAQQAP